MEGCPRAGLGFRRRLSALKRLPQLLELLDQALACDEDVLVRLLARHGGPPEDALTLAPFAEAGCDLDHRRAELDISWDRRPNCGRYRDRARDLAATWPNRSGLRWRRPHGARDREGGGAQEQSSGNYFAATASARTPAVSFTGSV